MKQTADSLDDATMARIEGLLELVAPRVLPSSWHQFRDYANCRFYRGPGLMVILEVELQDGLPWIHLSASRRDRVPSYHDLKDIKRLFVGAQRKAIQVFPAELEHYNMHDYCLHLFAPIDHDPLPDFRTETKEL